MATKAIKKVSKGTKETKETKVKKTVKKAVVAKKIVAAKKPVQSVILGSKATPESKKKTNSGQARMTNAKGSLTVSVYDVKGKSAGTLTLPVELFGQEINQKLLAQAVRVYRANQRQGTAKTKTRGEVSYSTRKLWKQKGTGRARHGGRGAPLFVKGGTAHGVKLRDYSLSLSKNMKKAALISALSSKVAEIKVVKGFEKIEQKTKIVASAFDTMGLMATKTLFVLPKDLENVYKAARNIKGVTVTVADRLTTYDILQTKTLVFMQESIGVLEKRVKGERN